MLSNGFHTMMYAVWEILDKLDDNVESISMNGIKLGKLIKRHPLKSKHTLTRKEINCYSRGLIEICQNWGVHGHPSWNVREKTPSSMFTAVFYRKEG